ncbi:hypothetical protein [Paraburkholderia nodosa]|uniref:hypothetical protein n=1 Tax=Paraburkholderia nodosa TaxID=392320 RepID=UPI00114CC787|nr:hypothetical protein [Paraburkholderia nodosa]
MIQNQPFFIPLSDLCIYAEVVDVIAMEALPWHAVTAGCRHAGEYVVSHAIRNAKLATPRLTIP